MARDAAPGHGFGWARRPQGNHHPGNRTSQGHVCCREWRLAWGNRRWIGRWPRAPGIVPPRLRPELTGKEPWGWLGGDVESDPIQSGAGRSAVRTWLSLNGQQLPLDLARHPRARRYVLRLRPDGSARVTIPRGGSVRKAREFAESQRAWLENQLRKLAKRPRHPREWRLGDELWLRGETVRIEEAVDEQPPLIRFGPEQLRVVQAAGDLRPIIERYLWKLAEKELPPRVAELAASERLSVRRVTVRNQRTRWGSCSRLSVISLNWRLIQVPPFVRDYVILHELCHLRHMDHSPRFWAEVARICPDHAPAEHWLRTHAVRLR